jgi:hypothetical protein
MKLSVLILTILFANTAFGDIRKAPAFNDTNEVHGPLLKTISAINKKKVISELKESCPHGSCKVTGTKPDATCGKKEAYIEITFICPTECAKKKIWFKKNGGETNYVKISAKGTFTQKLKAGTYVFEFSASDCFTFKTDKIKIEPQTRVAMTVEFIDNMISEEKPVIYLYPEKPTNVHVQLETKGELTFTYPAITGTEWNLTANPDGTIESNGKTYNYLFWEGQTQASTLKTNYTEGFIVTSDTLVEFLENSLATAGFNTKEAADFITYWAPRMVNNEKNYVHFMFTQEYDKIATLNIAPKPDNVLRLYMVWSPVTENNMIEVTPQQIPVFNRKGFTVVEWGGSEIPNIHEHL